MLEVQNFSKVFRGPDGPLNAVDNVSLQIKDGEFLSIHGASGSGKTTLLLSIGGLQTPDKGNVIVEEKNLYRMGANTRARFRAANIGFVFQQFYLIPYLNVMDNILVPSMAMPNPEADKRARQLIEKFKLSERSSHKPSQLSTGERQRTAMARALLNSPKLLLADEPTGNLDKDNAEIILKFLSEFAKSGKMVLMVTHSQEAAAYADREIHLKNGKVQ
ncbi:ABC transporter ATP-binding protein [Patescibacteria group bacterium]|nr:ABC transporter ATP-binding protein [Patescibacteria group bacterium]